MGKQDLRAAFNRIADVLRQQAEGWQNSFTARPFTTAGDVAALGTTNFSKKSKLVYDFEELIFYELI